MIRALGREPAHDGGDVLLGRRRARADPVEHVEAELGMARVEDGDRAATLAADRLDHIGDLAGWIETDHPAGPAPTGRHHRRDGFEAAGAGKDEAMRGPGWKGCQVVGDETCPPASAPGEGV